MRRAVITGIGAVTPLGNSFSSSWAALIAGRSGIAPVTRFDASALPWQHAAELKDFQSPARAKDALRYDPFVLYAHAAALEAASDAGIIGGLENAGIVIGSGRGGITFMEAAINKGRPGAYTMAGTTVSMAASYAANALGIKGHLAGISTACASGTVAIGEALMLVRSGRLDIALAGGGEAPLCAFAQQGYGIAGALSKSGEIRPFGRGRDGFVLGEGAAVIVIEERERAMKRGARIYAELAGYGNATDASHPTASDPEAQARAIKAALDDAGGADIKMLETSMPEQCLIMAHATGTRIGDSAEFLAITSALGEAAAKGAWLSALKPATGHMLAASGAFEAAAAAMALKEQCVLPTLKASDPEFPVRITPAALDAALASALCQSFGFGGVNAVLRLIRHGK